MEPNKSIHEEQTDIHDYFVVKSPDPEYIQ